MIEILRAMEALIAASEAMIGQLTQPLADAALTRFTRSGIATRSIGNACSKR